MKYTYIACTLFVVLSSISLLTQAQSQERREKDVLTHELEAQSLQWNKSTNAAGLLIDLPAQTSLVEAGYQLYDGDFRRPQAGKKGQALFLNTSGNLFLKDYYVQGYFSYSRAEKKGAEYNAGLIDPFRNMPYLVADTNASDWLNQHYNLGFKISTPKLADQWSLGLATNYEASSGAKQRDIRALNKFFALSIEPGIVYSVNESSHIGANLHYKNYKEESVNTNINNYINQSYFVLFGLGNAIEYVGTGRTMNYQGEALGGGLQYQYRGDVSVFASANYNIQAEDANISFTNSRPQGSVLSKNWDFNLNAEKNGAELKHIAEAKYAISKSNGIEYISEFESGLESDGYYVKYKSIRSKYDYTTGNIAYHLIRKRGGGFNWKASVRAAYDKLDNRYLIPASNMLAENMTYGMSLSKSLELSAAKKSQLVIGLNVDFRKNIAGEYQYKGADAESLTVIDLEQRNFEYFTSDFSVIEVPLLYSQGMKQDGTSFFIKISGHLQTTNSYTFNNRKGFMLSFGATF